MASGHEISGIPSISTKLVEFSADSIVFVKFENANRNLSLESEAYSEYFQNLCDFYHVFKNIFPITNLTRGLGLNFFCLVFFQLDIALKQFPNLLTFHNAF